MSTPGRGPARLVRGATLAVLTAFVSLLGHVVVGGALHVSMPMVVGVVALGAMAASAADTRRSFVEILAVVALAQPVFHLLASLGGHGTHASPATGVGIGMVLAHAVGATIAALVLSGAESALWALAGLLSPTRVPRPVPVRIDGAPRILPCPDAPAARRAPVFVPSRPLRGPPVVACAR